MKNVLIGIGLVLLGFGLGWWIHKPEDIPVKPVIVHDSANVADIEAKFLDTHVSKTAFDSVVNELAQGGKLSNKMLSQKESTIKALLDSLDNIGQKPTVDNFYADSTFRRIPITITTFYDDSTIVSTIYAEVNVHQEFWGEPFNIFHDLRIRTAPINHTLSIIPKPNIRTEYEPRGFYWGGDGGWMTGNIGLGLHAGFGNIRLGAMGIINQGTVFTISVDKN